MPVWNQLALQESSSVNMHLISSFHDHAMVVVSLVVCLVFFAIITSTQNTLVSRFTQKNELLEMVWTVIPGLIIVGMAMPSLYSLYLMEESLNPAITFKAIGHQWYWSYELSDFKEVYFDSYLVSDSLGMSDFRLLEVDSSLVVPERTELRLVTTSADVIHSWTIPSLGVKVDSVPGRLNQALFFPNRIGIFFGQCSEICGSLHSFMPICLEVVKLGGFTEWVKSFYN